MHFRHFLISALMVGAAIYLPNHAFAEKNPASDQAASQKELVQAALPSENAANGSAKVEQAASKANVSVKAEKAAPKANVPVNLQNTTAKAKTVVLPEDASKDQRGANPHPSHPVSAQAASKQPAATAKSLPEQAKGNGYGLTAAKKNGTVSAQAKAAAGSKAAVKKITTPLASKTSTDTAVKKHDPSPKMVEPEESGLDISESMRVEGAEPEPAEPVVPRKGQVPFENGKMPNADQPANPTPQRANNSGGSSNDRVSQGMHTISYLDKWFEWNKHYEIQLVHPFLSQYALRNHQWVNAPPAPPPQTSSFFINR